MKIIFSIGVIRKYDIISTIRFMDYSESYCNILLYTNATRSLNPFKIINESMVYKYIYNNINKYIVIANGLNVFHFISVTQTFAIDPRRLCILDSDWENVIKAACPEDRQSLVLLRERFKKN